MSGEAKFKVTDDPMTGVTAETPQGEMWFESTDEAHGLLSVFCPGVEFEWVQIRYENGERVEAAHLLGAVA